MRRFTGDEYRMADGNLRSFTMVGGYPMFYQAEDSSVLCPKCATEADADSDASPLILGTINWEDASLHCDECSERIESAYAEDEAE